MVVKFDVKFASWSSSLRRFETVCLVKFVEMVVKFETVLDDVDTNFVVVASQFHFWVCRLRSGAIMKVTKNGVGDPIVL